MTWLDALTLETVIVHTETASFKGLKVAVHDDCIVLKDALLLELEQQTLIDGNVVVPREQVQYLQVVGA